MLGGGLQAVEPVGPELIEEAAQLGQAVWVGAVDPPRAFPAFAEEPSPLEHGEVLRDRGTGDLKARGYFTGAQLARADQLEDLAPARLGDGTEHGFHEPEYKQLLT